MTQITLRTIDLECSDLMRADGAEVVEIGFVDVSLDTETRETTIGTPASLLFRPENGMKLGALAAHHITMSKVKDLGPCTDDDLRLAATGAADGKPASSFLVAHNWAYEAQFFTPEIIGAIRPICTMKAAARMFPDCATFSNQGVRYYLGLEDLPDEYALPVHRAGPDAYVTAAILAKMLETERVSDLVKWTAMPRFYSRFPMGKHKGAAFSDVPADYMQWCLRQPDMDVDVRAACTKELERRRGT